MTYFPTSSIDIADTGNADAFHRLRVSEPVRQFSAMSEYTDNPLIWETAFVSTGSSTYQQNQCAVRLSTGSITNGASSIRQTRRYMRYLPGKSLLVLQTFVMSAAQTSAVAEIGYYDANNGVFFQRSGSTLNIILRSNTSGTPTDTVIPQASWNTDKLDGTGASGVTLDLTKANILLMDLQFLGVGRVRVGFDFGSAGVVYAHQFNNANSNTTAYMSTGCLPIRGRVYNTGSAGGTVTMDMICSSVANEGAPNSAGDEFDSDRIIQFSASNGGATGKMAGVSLIPITSVRAARTLGGSGVVTNRGQILPNSYSIYAANDSYYEVWLNPGGSTGGVTGASWISANYGSSIGEYDSIATGFSPSGGYRIDSGYITSASKTTGNVSFKDFPIVFTGLNSVQDTVSVVAKVLNGTGMIAATLDWTERY